MGIPSAFAFYLETLHGFITANKVFQCSCNYVMNTRHSIGTRRPLIKNKRSMPFTITYTFLKSFFFFPNGKHFFCNVC